MANGSVFAGEDPRWEAAYLAAAGGVGARVAHGAQSTGTIALYGAEICERFADATVARLDERAKARAEQIRAAREVAIATAFAQGTYEETLTTARGPVGMVWRVVKVWHDRMQLARADAPEVGAFVDILDLVSGEVGLRPTVAPTPVEQLPEMPAEIEDAIAALADPETVLDVADDTKRTACCNNLVLAIRRALDAATKGAK